MRKVFTAIGRFLAQNPILGSLTIAIIIAVLDLYYQEQHLQIVISVTGAGLIILIWVIYKFKNNNSITIPNIDEIIKQQTAELREQIKALKKDKEVLHDLVDTKDELHSIKILELSGKIADLEKQVEEKESKIREIAANYENVDIASLPLLHKEAINLFTQGKIDEAFALLDEAKLEAQEAKLEAKNKAAADTRILKAQLAELKYDFENAEANYLKAAAIFPSFGNNLLVANFYHKLNQFK